MNDCEVLLMTDHEIATEVVFEDEEVRVWNQVVKKGEDIPKHEHRLDYFLLNISGEGPIHVQFHDETGGLLVKPFNFFQSRVLQTLLRKVILKLRTMLAVITTPIWLS